ncbi:MAG: hypothetical protein EAX91_15515 [Candidatus Lokiarchaeota archaeon]|nr:hypothetical protein [Candidatus Lokiarchaeota archaeon]
MSNKEVKQEEVSLDDEQQLIGGMGISTAIFTREVPSDINPFSEQNLLILSTGPICGTAVPFCGRYFLMAKSPLTNILGEASSGGFFGKELKSTGYDFVVINGKSEEPVIIYINDDNVELLDASDIWGKGTQESDKLIKEKLGDSSIKVATIGPAGEKLVKYACIINDKHHASGRCGLGAVMGSKKLKAIAVKGTQKIAVQDKDKVMNAAKELRELLSTSGLGMVMADSGTPVHLDSMASVGDINMKNWTVGRWPGVKNIGAKALNARGEVKMHGCFNCPTACRGYVEYQGDWVSRPEYETLGMLGSNLMVDDLEVLIKWNLLVNDLGLDSISLGGVLGCFLEVIERKLLSESYENLGFSEDQIWGNSNAIEKLIPMIANREGVGDKLADGVRVFCKNENLPEELSIQGKGLEVPAHEPRANNMTALDYATTPRGAYHCYEPMHLSSYMNQKEEIGLTGGNDKFGATEDIAEAVIKIQDASEAYSAMGGCIFGFWFIHKLQPWIDGLNGITGRSYTVDSFMEVGQRIVNMKRKFNVKCGISKADDAFGNRFSTPLEKGGTRKNVPPLENLLRMYYEKRNWNNNGIPNI